MKIKCIGFSVTGYGEFPYSMMLKEKLFDIGISADVSYASVGGLSVDALGYLLDAMIGSDAPDVIVLEIATSWFSIIRKNQSDADIFLEKIVKYFEDRQLNIVFLNLYRKDISDQDIVVSAINKYKNNYPVLDVKSKYRERLKIGRSDGTTDGVHPTNETIEEIACDLADFISKNANDFKSSFIDKADCRKFNILIPFVDGGAKYKFDNRHGLLIEGLKISAISNCNFEFESPTAVSGILFMYGPDTNGVIMRVENEIIEVPMHDNMSFYRRLGYRYFGKRLVTKIRMEFNYSDPKIVLDREPWEKFEYRACYFMGFTQSLD